MPAVIVREFRGVVPIPQCAGLEESQHQPLDMWCEGPDDQGALHYSCRVCGLKTKATITWVEGLDMPVMAASVEAEPVEEEHHARAHHARGATHHRK